MPSFQKQRIPGRTTTESETFTLTASPTLERGETSAFAKQQAPSTAWGDRLGQKAAYPEPGRCAKTANREELPRNR
jgi:hypothetical protein